MSRAAPIAAAAALAAAVVLTATSPHLLIRWSATLVGLVLSVWLLRGPAGQWLRSALDRPLREGSTLTVGALLGEVLCPTLVVAITCGSMWQILLGDAPLGSDHPIHLFHGWVMAERLLPTGRLGGWVHDRGAGYPAGVLYPIGAPLLLAVVRGVTPSSVGWDTIYGVGFLVGWCAVQLSMYLAGRLAAGRLAGLLAALFSLLDRGAYRQSGWTFAVEWGVWPVSLSMALAIASVFVLHRALVDHRPSSSRLAASAFLAGGAVITHPMSVAFLGLAIPLTVAHASIESGGRRPLAVLWRGLVAAVLGVGLSAFWLLPLLALSDEARALGTGSVTLRQQAEALILFDFFKHLWVVPAAFALMGAIGAWRQRLPTARLATILLAVIAVGINGTTLTGLEIDRFWERLGNIQPDRFYMYLRPMAYVLAGVGVVWVFRRAEAVVGEGVGRGRVWALRVVACLAFGSFLVPVAESVAYNVVANRLAWRSRPEGFHHFESAAEFIRNDARRWGGRPRAIWPSCGGNASLGHGSHCFELSSAWTDIGHLHTGYHSGAAYVGLFNLRRDSATLRALGVRYRVELSDRRERLLHRAGPLRVYEVPNVSEVPYTVEGDAEVRLESFEDELVRLRVSGASEGARVIFHIPYFSRWHAYVDGAEVTMSRQNVGSVRDCMVVPVRDGTVELRYVRGTPEVLGSVVTVLCLLGCVLLLLAGRIRRASRVAPRLDRLTEAVARVRQSRLGKAGRVAAVVLVVSAGLAGLGLLGHAFFEDRPGFDTVDNFSQARVWYLEGGSRHPCRRTWSGVFRCGPGSHQWVGPRYVWTTMGDTRGVISAPPSRNARLHVDFPSARMGRALVGGVGIENKGRGSSRVDMNIRAAGRHLHKVSYSAGPGWRAFRADTSELEGQTTRLEFVITCDNPSRRFFIFRARTTD